MKFQIKDSKVLIMGIQGAGKTRLANELTKQMKNPIWYVINIDDVKSIDKTTTKVLATKKGFSELNELCAKVIEMGKKKLTNCFIIDEADFLIPKNLVSLQDYSYIYDLMINHRHYGLSVFLLTRRPQDLNSMIAESCEYQFIFALPSSDNVMRKLNSIDGRIGELMMSITKDNHKFIYYRLGEAPRLISAITISKLKNGGK